METWHPLGVVAVISAFNFPAAVWSWNTAVALVCGDSVVWKPSPMTPLTSMACAALLDRAAAEAGAPVGLHRAGDRRRGGRRGAGRQPRCRARYRHRLRADGGRGRAPRRGPARTAACSSSGGNNAAVVAPSADLELATRGIVFAAAGTAGQRCTSLRRVIAHEDIVDDCRRPDRDVFGRLSIGDPIRGRRCSSVR